MFGKSSTVHQSAEALYLATAMHCAVRWRLWRGKLRPGEKRSGEQWKRALLLQAARKLLIATTAQEDALSVPAADPRRGNALVTHVLVARATPCTAAAARRAGVRATIRAVVATVAFAAIAVELVTIRAVVATAAFAAIAEELVTIRAPGAMFRAWVA